MPLKKTDGSCFKLPQPERKAPQLLLQGSATGLFTPSDNLDGSLAQQGRARGYACAASRGNVARGTLVVRFGMLPAS
jgi:hypothetical protein